MHSSRDYVFFFNTCQKLQSHAYHQFAYSHLNWISPLLNGYIQTADIAHYYTHFCLLNIVVVYRFNRPNTGSSVSFL